MKRRHESDENLAQQKPEPSDQATEVVADSCEDGVCRIAPTEPEIVSAHAMLGLEMADHGFDRGPAAKLALDLGRHPTLLAGDEDLELVVWRCIVAAIPFVRDDAIDGIADQRLHPRDHGCQGVAVIGIARQRLRMSDELAAFGMADGGGDGDLDPNS